MGQAEFTDPRLVTVYDAECRWARDDDFFLAVVNESPAARVLDLGCGSGRLALGMAAAGHSVTGVDPARPMLDAARAKPGADRVSWLEGTSAALRPAAFADAFDIAVMTSHVVQFLMDDEFVETLADLKRALAPGGRLAFDSRDPRARGWERWNPADSRRELTLPDGRVVITWTEVTGAGNGAVRIVGHNVFIGGEDVTSTAVLRFRTEDEVRRGLREAGFAVEHVYGGWQRQPPCHGDGELIVIARA
ncbi:MAG: class I SAM-dependent methyltransferase [Actinobacteria bacterium]|nr:class I SAM-dependent methyltransferase [Actinomycetota bacterium]MBO0787666.1 class I SAM-dependent methyltransferase [Actinomycetota bacterium]